MRKERFPAHRRSKFQPQGDGSFHVLERIKDNAYKMDLSCEYGVNTTFNISDLSLFDVGDDLTSNPFLEKGDDDNQLSTPKDPLEVSIGLIIRLMARKPKKTFNELIQNIWAKRSFKTSTNDD